MKIDIDSLNYDELVELNHKIVARLKFLDSLHAHKEMMRFSPGDQVSFVPPGREKQFGTLVKYNKKTSHCNHRFRTEVECFTSFTQESKECER